MKEELRTESAFLERFRAEARHAGGLGHPGIARVFDYGEGPDVAYLVMELVRGQPLSELMTGSDELSDSLKVSILRQSADALQVAHDAGAVATHPGQDHSHTRAMLAPVARSHAPGPDRIAAAGPAVVSATRAAASRNDLREVGPARQRQAHVPTLLFVALIALIAIGIWTAIRGGVSPTRRSTTSATLVTQTPEPESSAAPTDLSTTAAAAPLPITAAPTTVPITPESTTPPTVPPSVAPTPSVATPATAAPSSAPAPAGDGKVGQDEAIRFVTSYYASLAAGDYQTPWPLLSEKFRAQRNLTFERYIAYWEHHSITLNDLRFREGPGSDEGRVRFDARYSSSTGTVNETDEITIRRQADGTLIIVAQEIV